MNRTPKDRLTVTFDPTHDTIKKAKVLAAERGMTVSALFEEMLDRELRVRDIARDNLKNE